MSPWTLTNRWDEEEIPMENGKQIEWWWENEVSNMWTTAKQFLEKIVSNESLSKEDKKSVLWTFILRS